MRRGGYALLPLLVLAATACGAPSGKALDTKVEAAVVAQQGGRQVVSSVDCSDQAPPANTVAGGLGTVTADHTCTVTFSNGTPTQVWAVNVLDLGASHPVQLLYRTDHNGDGQPAVTVDVARLFSAEMALLNGGTAAKARCRAGSPAAPAGSTATAAPDHVCSIRIPGHGRERWAVRILGSSVQLLFQLG
jgi:hypothetical protein